MLHSKQWHYSLHKDFQNCYSTRRSPTGFFSSNSTRVPIHHPSTNYIQRILHPESNSTCRRQRALRVLPLHTKGKETFKKFYAWKARRSSRNPSVCPTKPSKDIPGIPDHKTFQGHSRHSSLSSLFRHSRHSRHSSHS